MVAKSFQEMEITTEPYKVNGREYVKVRNAKTGALRQVRWYTEAEYEKMYPEVKIIKPAASQKHALGFDNGYITIFKGDTYSNLEWFKASIARYARHWGWYIVSTEEIPADLPPNVIPVQLKWEDVSDDGEHLKAEGLVKAFVETILYDENPSQYKGNIGDRLDIVVTVKKALPLEGAYGHSTMHIMVDADQNAYIWTTSAKTLVEGNEYHLRGTVKDHRIYRNCKQTVLTRCMEVK